VPAQTPVTSRVTPERIAALVQRYAAIEGLAGPSRTARGEKPWSFTVEIVAGLQHRNEDGGLVDAWAVVNPQVDPSGTGGVAHVQVRDIDATPIPGFDGDPMLEIRVTIAHELFHAVVAEAMAGKGFTIPAEERIVETAAQAMVLCERLDAPVMARAVRALPSALRARVAARAPARARGGPMDPEMVMKALNALEGGDAAAALEILKGLIAAAAGGGAPEPDGDEPPAVEAAKVEPVAPGVGDYGAAPTDARRAKDGGEMQKDMARARAAANELEAMAAAQRPAAKEALVVGLRARLGSAFTPASEKRIMSAGDYGAAKLIAEIIEETIGAGGEQRARSGVDPISNAGPERPGALPSIEQLRTEGFNESWLVGFQAAARLGPEHAQAYIDQGRASSRARTAKNGAAS